MYYLHLLVVWPVLLSISADARPAILGEEDNEGEEKVVRESRRRLSPSRYATEKSREPGRPMKGSRVVRRLHPAEQDQPWLEMAGHELGDQLHSDTSRADKSNDVALLAQDYDSLDGDSELRDEVGEVGDTPRRGVVKRRGVAVAAVTRDDTVVIYTIPMSIFLLLLWCLCCCCCTPRVYCTEKRTPYSSIPGEQRGF